MAYLPKSFTDKYPLDPDTFAGVVGGYGSWKYMVRYLAVFLSARVAYSVLRPIFSEMYDSATSVKEKLKIGMAWKKWEEYQKSMPVGQAETAFLADYPEFAVAISDFELESSGLISGENYEGTDISGGARDVALNTVPSDWVFDKESGSWVPPVNIVSTDDSDVTQLGERDLYLRDFYAHQRELWAEKDVETPSENLSYHTQLWNYLHNVLGYETEEIPEIISDVESGRVDLNNLADDWEDNITDTEAGDDYDYDLAFDANETELKRQVEQGELYPSEPDYGTVDDVLYGSATLELQNRSARPADYSQSAVNGFPKTNFSNGVENKMGNVYKGRDGLWHHPSGAVVNNARGSSSFKRSSYPRRSYGGRRGY